MRIITGMISDGEGEEVLDSSRDLTLLRGLLVPTSRIGIITTEGGDGGWGEEWDIVDVKDTIAGFEVTVLIEGKREQKLTFVFMDNRWCVDGIPNAATAIHLIPAEEEGEGLRIWLEEEVE